MIDNDEHAQADGRPDVFTLPVPARGNLSESQRLLRRRGDTDQLLEALIRVHGQPRVDPAHDG